MFSKFFNRTTFPNELFVGKDITDELYVAIGDKILPTNTSSLKDTFRDELFVGKGSGAL